MNVLPHNAPRQLVHVHSAEEGSSGAVEDAALCRRSPMPRPQMNVIVLHEALLQVKDTMLHEMLPQMNATTNAVMSSDEQHHAARDVSRLHETWPPMVQAEDERLATQCTTPASTRALS